MKRYFLNMFYIIDFLILSLFLSPVFFHSHLMFSTNGGKKKKLKMLNRFQNEKKNLRLLFTISNTAVNISPKHIWNNL